MNKVSEYEKQAAECRQMANRMPNPDQKAQLEEMAQAWDALARDRIELLRRGMVAPATNGCGDGGEPTSPLVLTVNLKTVDHAGGKPSTEDMTR
jgi:hypothetical protein